MPKKNNTIYIILGLLNHEELSGYDIKKRIDDMISHFWEVGYGQIYPTLKTMEAKGLVFRKPDGNYRGPERNLYSITEEGKKVLKEWLVLPEDKEYVKYEILLKLFFGSMVTVEDNIERIETFKERQLQSVKILEIFEANLKQVMQEDEDHLYYYLTVLFGEQIYKAYIEWAKQAVKVLKEVQENKQKEDNENHKV